MGKNITLSQIAVAMADIRRVQEKLEEQISGIREVLFRLQEESNMAGTPSAVRPLAAIEDDENNARLLLQSWKRKRQQCERRLEELKTERYELQLKAARAQAAAKKSQDELKAGGRR